MTDNELKTSYKVKLKLKQEIPCVFRTFGVSDEILKLLSHFVYVEKHDRVTCEEF